MKPEFITFTGADDQTDLASMCALAADYPIEWGILFSPKRQGAGRYPSEPGRFIDKGLRLAAHLCGGDARDVIEHGYSEWDTLLENYFSRAQINTADRTVNADNIKNWADTVALRAILQCRGEFPNIRAVDILFDASGGHGIYPASWPKPAIGRLNGYAGGLNPANVGDAVQKIAARFEHGCSGATYWIDMESGVRDAEDRFDLGKCRAVCEAVYGARP
jgi:hypothetical protein